MTTHHQGLYLRCTSEQWAYIPAPTGRGKRSPKVNLFRVNPPDWILHHYSIWGNLSLHTWCASNLSLSHLQAPRRNLGSASRGSRGKGGARIKRHLFTFSKQTPLQMNLTFIFILTLQVRKTGTEKCLIPGPGEQTHRSEQHRHPCKGGSLAISRMRSTESQERSLDARGRPGCHFPCHRRPLALRGRPSLLGSCTESSPFGGAEPRGLHRFLGCRGAQPG